MKSRLIVLFAILLSGTLVACSLTDLLPRREARVTATPTRTLKPTFTATVTATATPIPSATPRPTNTATPTSPPTPTPVPSDTPTSTPTPTVTNTPPPSPTPTNTAKPTRRPTRRPTKTPVPKPTNTPPPPFSASIVRGYPHCGGYSGVTGHVRHANGSPYGGVAVGVWSRTWDGAVAISQDDGKFEVTLNNVPPDHYFVAVVKIETCPQINGLYTARECRKLSNILEVTKTEDCNVNRVTEVDIVGP